jgi:hypothetical protein
MLNINIRLYVVKDALILAFSLPSNGLPQPFVIAATHRVRERRIILKFKLDRVQVVTGEGRQSCRLQPIGRFSPKWT